MTRHLLVGNPSAQSGRAALAIARARELLSGRGIDVRVVHTEPAGRTPALVARAIEELTPDVVLCLGGDGTFNEVARGLLHARDRRPDVVPLMGMLPMGTANDQGRSFGLQPGPEHVEEHLAVVLAGHVTRLDGGCIDALDEHGSSHARTMFFDSASFGMAPDILATRNRDRKDLARVPVLRRIYRDRAVYVGAAVDRLVASFVESPKFDAVVDTNAWSRTWHGVTDLVIQATPIFGGGWVFDRRGRPDDGRFELIAITSRAEWVARVLDDLATNPFPPPREHFTASRFELTFERPGAEAIASQIDGEEWVRGDRFRVEVLPGVVPLITPHGFVAPWAI